MTLPDLKKGDEFELDIKSLAFGGMFGKMGK